MTGTGVLGSGQKCGTWGRLCSAGAGAAAAWGRWRRWGWEAGGYWGPLGHWGAQAVRVQSLVPAGVGEEVEQRGDPRGLLGPVLAVLAHCVTSRDALLADVLRASLDKR